MKRVTRNIEPGEARDLLERVPRACVGFATEEGPEVEPAAFVLRDGRYFVGLSSQPGRTPSPGSEVVLVIDEGLHFFDLRAIYVRGRADEAASPDGATDGRVWMEVAPTKIVAWDYATMRQADT